MSRSSLSPQRESSTSPRRYSRHSPERKQSGTPPLSMPYACDADAVNKEICKDFRRGLCQRGSSCRFSHDINASDEVTSSVVGGSGNFAPGDWYCSVCKAHVFAKRDRCYKCMTPKEGAGGRGFPLERDVIQKPPLGDLCNDFLMGNCRRATCRFSHDPKLGMEWMAQAMRMRDCPRREERRPERRSERARSPSPYGNIEYERFKSSADRRRYDVPPPPPMPVIPPPLAFNSRSAPPSRELCTDFKHGRCTRGDFCKYVHEKGPLPGDWICKHCNISNFARREECFKCREVKGSEPKRNYYRSRSPGRREDYDRLRYSGSERRARDPSRDRERSRERERRYRERKRSRERRSELHRSRERSRDHSRERSQEDYRNGERFESRSRSRSRAPRR